MRPDAAGVEARAIETWFAEARRRQVQHVAPAASALVSRSADAMARHRQLASAQIEMLKPSLAFWQMFLPSALGSDPLNFTDVRARLPHSFNLVRRGVAAVAGRQQAVFAAFHMAAFPIVAAMLAAAAIDEHGEPGHVLIARRNVGWLRLDAGRWVQQLGRVIATDPRGLRQLQAGLGDGSIRRLLILVDGPHAAATPGTHVLDGIPTIGFKTGLLDRLMAMRIPVVPLAHAWESERLALEWHPAIDAMSDRDGRAAIARVIDDLLRRYPDQWLNWASPSLRHDRLALTSSDRRH
jgi:hypothetical protein